jgi:integrase
VKGHVRRRGSTWSVFYDRPRDPETGKRRKTSKNGFKTRAEAQRWLNSQLVDLGRGSYVEPSQATLGEFLREDWLPALGARGLRPNTQTAYEAKLRKHVLRRDIASVPLQRLRPEHLNRLYAQLVAEKLSARSVRFIAMLLGQALKDAERWGRIMRSPAPLATPPAAAAAARDAEQARNTWSASELRQFLASVREDRDYPLWLLLATTGLRRGETLGLRWRDVDFERSRLSVVQTLTNLDGSAELAVSTPKTTKGTRSVAIDATTLEALRAHRRAQAAEQLAFGPEYETSEFVFRNVDGSPVSPNALSLAFQHRIKAAKVPKIRLHDLRHTHATLALAAGVHPKVVSERLGHSTVSITLDIYSHAIPAMQEEAAERVASLVFGDSR